MAVIPQKGEIWRWHMRDGWDQEAWSDVELLEDPVFDKATNHPQYRCLGKSIAHSENYPREQTTTGRVYFQIEHLEKPYTVGDREGWKRVGLNCAECGGYCPADDYLCSDCRSAMLVA